MYDYLAKIILLGPSGSGKSCLLHRFVKGEWRVLSSQTIGVEFASKIVKVGAPGRRKRVKLQLWDTAGTERFRSVSRSYYRGAAGAILVYDVANQRSFNELGTFLHDARALASPQMTVVLAGNKIDLAENAASQQVLMDDFDQEPNSLASSMRSPGFGPTFGNQQRVTISEAGRVVAASTAANWASQNRVAASMEVSAFTGNGVDEIFNKLARTILTKIELGEIDPDDPMSGIQYGDADYYRFDDGDSSIRSGGLTSDGYTGGSVRKRRRKGGWSDVLHLGSGNSATGTGRSRCC